MKILILHHCDSWGGAGVSLRDLCRMLAGEHDVTVCLPHLDSEVDRELKALDGIKTVAVDADMGMISAYNGGPSMLTRTFARNLLRIRESGRRLGGILKDGYDVVILNSITLAWAAKTAKRSGAKAVMYIRETKVDNPAYRYCKRLINKHCDGVLFISEYDRRITTLKVKEQAVVRDCIELDKYDVRLTRDEACEKFGLDKNKFNLLYVGGTDELKGHSVIVSAMSKICAPEIQLIAAGGGAEAKRENSDNIIYLGKVFDMPTLYRACDALVFPSTKGHQARPAFEAGALGLPVIMSDFPQTADEVRNGDNGLTFKPCDSDELRDKIFELYNSPELCRALGEKNGENTKLRHAFDSVRLDALNFLNKIAR